MSISTALKARREALRNREDGFTLIELLVVVIIIGILAAIAIPIYIGVQNNAKDSAVKSDLNNDKTALVAYYTANGSAALSATNFNSATLGANGFATPTVSNYNSASDVPTYKASSTTQQFCLYGKSGSGNTFYLTSNGSISTTDCGTTVANW